MNHCSIIGGPGHTVEVDESVFRKRKYNRGCSPYPVGCRGFDRETKEGFLIPVPDRSAATMLPILYEWIEPGTTIYSDQWRAYNQLSQNGFNHEIVNHSLYFRDPETGVHTNRIEGMWGNAKAKLQAMNGTSKNLLFDYLCEFMWAQRFKQNRVFYFWNHVITNNH